MLSASGSPLHTGNGRFKILLLLNKHAARSMQSIGCGQARCGCLLQGSKVALIFIQLSLQVHTGMCVLPGGQLSQAVFD